jgi:phosphoribosyl 1,2-cyclic phosphodiesterase
VEVLCLGSGSSGNAYVIQCGETTVLVDAGIPIRHLSRLLREANVDLSSISAIFISHEHTDHVRALRSVLRHCNAPVFATEGTIRSARDSVEAEWVAIRSESTISVDGLSITALTVSHDAREPVAYSVSAGQTTAGILTDLGVPNGLAGDLIRRSDLVIVESNYDERMLRHGAYPGHLKRRIRSELGHLSNHDCARLLAESLTPRTGTVWLAHLSENNNTPDIAVAESSSALRSAGVFPQIQALPRFASAPVRWSAGNAARPSFQTSLGL